MKTNLKYVGIALFFMITKLYSQNRAEIIKQEKVKFINEFCKFSEDDAKKFWVIHDEMETKLKAVRKKMRSEMRTIKENGVDNTSEDDLKKAYDNRKKYEKELYDIRWEYNQKMVDLVGIKKVSKFFEGEAAFRKKLLDRLKDRMDEED